MHIAFLYVRCGDCQNLRNQNNGPNFYDDHLVQVALWTSNVYSLSYFFMGEKLCDQGFHLKVLAYNFWMSYKGGDSIREKDPELNVKLAAPKKKKQSFTHINAFVVLVVCVYIKNKIISNITFLPKCKYLSCRWS